LPLFTKRGASNGKWNGSDRQKATKLRFAVSTLMPALLISMCSGRPVASVRAVQGSPRPATADRRGTTPVGAPAGRTRRETAGTPAGSSRKSWQSCGLIWTSSRCDSVTD
jgi:hypothetical protein